MTNSHADRNFDGLADKFARKVYGGLKGEIRLAVIWRDLVAVMPSIESGPPLRILDIGGGLGQFTVRLAALGHSVVYNDVSAEMYQKAQNSAQQQGLDTQISWHHGPYQDLDNLGQFDLVLCHAVIEWLAHPGNLVAHIRRFVTEGGRLSLAFYNQNGLVYRNLIRGNFRLLEADFKPDIGSLTPIHPLLPAQVAAWLEASELSPCWSSGIRVFNDYVTTVRGGHEDPQSVIEMELKHSLIEPYKWLGRYIHFIAETELSRP